MYVLLLVWIKLICVQNVSFSDYKSRLFRLLTQRNLLPMMISTFEKLKNDYVRNNDINENSKTRISQNKVSKMLYLIKCEIYHAMNNVIIRVNVILFVRILRIIVYFKCVSNIIMP